MQRPVQAFGASAPSEGASYGSTMFSLLVVRVPRRQMIFINVGARARAAPRQPPVRRSVGSCVGPVGVLRWCARCRC
eukprot:COSAG03_NODE_1092_length_4831_cov_17.559594_4_plen_77_part_00